MLNLLCSFIFVQRRKFTKKMTNINDKKLIRVTEKLSLEFWPNMS